MHFCIKNKDKYFFIGFMQKFSLLYISFYSIPVTPASVRAARCKGPLDRLPVAHDP